MFATKRYSQTFGEKASEAPVNSLYSALKKCPCKKKPGVRWRSASVYVAGGEIIFNEYRYATLLAAAKSDGLNSKCPTNERVLP